VIELSLIEIDMWFIEWCNCRRFQVAFNVTSAATMHAEKPCHHSCILLLFLIFRLSELYTPTGCSMKT